MMIVTLQSRTKLLRQLSKMYTPFKPRLEYDTFPARFPILVCRLFFSRKRHCRKKDTATLKEGKGVFFFMSGEKGHFHKSERKLSQQVLSAIVAYCSDHSLLHPSQKHTEMISRHYRILEKVLVLS